MEIRHSSLFSQLLGVIDRSLFGRLVRETEAEKSAKGFMCWEQLVAMLFCQLAQAKSLREIVGGLQCCEGTLRHLGVEKAPVRRTLSYPNSRRPWQLFERLFYQLIDTPFLRIDGVRASASTALRWKGLTVAFLNTIFSSHLYACIVPL
jgi:hypothetical protein